MTGVDCHDDVDDTAMSEVAKLEAELEVCESWQFMWVLIFIARSVALALLADCNFEVLNLDEVSDTL